MPSKVREHPPKAGPLARNHVDEYDSEIAEIARSEDLPLAYLEQLVLGITEGTEPPHYSVTSVAVTYIVSI